MTALYTSGTISLVNGSAVINGIDTAWETALIVGGTVHVEAEGNPLPILPDDSTGANEHPITDTQMTAAIKWQGATGVYNYALVRENTYTSAQAANSNAIAELIRRLQNPTIAAIAGVQGQQDHLILLTGPSTATIIPRTSLIQGIEADASVETPADLETYESEATGFVVLVADAGDERAALYFKLSATAGDWSVPAFLTGEQGIKGDTGDTGITWRGQWNNVDAYAANHVVRNNKSAWIALRANTNVAPPVLPTEANADWELFARAGVDGTGTGDVVGPNGGVEDNDFVLFADNTGKLLKKAANNVVGNALLAQVAPAIIKGRLTAGAGNVEDLTAAQARQVLGGWEFIGTYNLAGLSVVDITNLSAFRTLRINVSAVFNANGPAELRFSENNGTTFGADSDEFRFTYVEGRAPYSGTPVPSANDGAGTANPFLYHGGDTGWSTGGEMTIYEFNQARPATTLATVRLNTATDRYIRTLGSGHKRGTAQNAIRLFLSTTTIQFGKLDIEGIRS